MKKLLTVALAIILALGLYTPPTTAQIVVGPEQFGFAFASDYNKWLALSSGDVAVGAVVVTLKDPTMGQQVTPDGRSFRPFSTSTSLSIDAGGANPETLTPSAVTCVAGALTCSFSVTTSFAHVGNFTIQSGTFGLGEAFTAIGATAGGKGTILIANGFGGSTSTITSGFNGSSNVNVLDVRIGVFQFYTSSGSGYTASLSPFNTQTAAGATVTAAVGAPFFYTAINQATNHGITDLALGANTNGAALDFLKTRTTNADGRATTAVTTGDDLALVNAWGADGTNYINSAAIEFASTGTIAATRVPSKIIFKTGTDAAPTVLTAALTIGADQKVNMQGSNAAGANVLIQGIPTYVEATADTATAGATFTPATGLTWTMPATTAINYPFHCVLSWTQATAATANAFQIQTATNAPTNGALEGLASTGATAIVRSGAVTYNSTSATTIVTATPGGTGQTDQVILDGFVEQPSAAGTAVVTIGVATTSGGTDITTIKRGSYCRLF